ncbi:MAG: hypothetical protein ACXWQO_11255 [Bdellovibrionota bacterium]
MRNSLYFMLLILLSGCVGTTFGNHQDIEEYPLRGATEQEGKRLKKCLRTAFNAQQIHKQKTGKFYRHSSELPVDDACQGFILAQKRTEEGYEIMAQFHEEETTVRWTINEQGVIEEQLDPNADADIDF